MSIATLQNWLIANRGFRTRFDAMLIDSVAQQFPRLEPYGEYYDQVHDWRYLLFCASLLARGDRPVTQEIALRIAHAALLSRQTSAAEKGAAVPILDELSNRRAVELAERRQLIPASVERSFGVAASIDWTRRTFEHSIVLDSGETIYANRFQRAFWIQARGADTWVAASAPTSAGKSFIVLQWLTRFIQDRERCTVVYVVPTRALIQQVDRDVRGMFRDLDISDVQVETVPLLHSAPQKPKRMLIFTQERLHYYLSTLDDAVTFDALVVDEAHKIGDRHRGVLLQDVIERITKGEDGPKVIFAAPLAENPGELLTDAPSGIIRQPVASEDVTVNQNLIWLDCNPAEPDTWLMSVCLPDRLVSLGLLEVPRRLSTTKGKLAHLAVACDSGDGGNLIYVNRAYDAEQTAEEVYKLLEEDSCSLPELQELADLAKIVVHPEYALAAYVLRGVGFHYGNMPLILRTEIERLFSAGIIRFLVCTSTLVEGVNLPCRNLFVRGPKKGNKPMGAADFWNLAGRAGRWGQEFQGNIICIDANSLDAWSEGAPRRRGRYRIQRTTDDVLNNRDDLLAFIRAGTPRDIATDQPELEYVTSYLAATALRYGSLAQAPWARRVAPSRLFEVDSAIVDLLSTVRVPPYLVLRHAGVSPVAMTSLLNAFHLYPGPADELIVIDPREEGSAKRYAKVFELIGHHLSPVLGTGGRALALAILTREWMLGYPISRLVSTRVSRERRKRKAVDVGSLIRRTLEDVEEIARFQAPRYLSCYSDVLGLFLEEIGRDDLIKSQVDMTLMLEFGVPGGTQLSFMSLGLSRTSANMLALEMQRRGIPEEAKDLATLDETAARAWLLATEIQDWDLPTLVLREIADMKSRFN